MRIRILCVGRLKDGPERELVDDYVARARKTGASLGYRAVEEIEIDAGGGKEKEAERILARRGKGKLVRLDERGQAWTSMDLSKRLQTWRDAGEDADFVVGGADGLAASLDNQTSLALGFGAQTWPHKLVRVMLAEQVYRALSIEAGSPYHRE